MINEPIARGQWLLRFNVNDLGLISFNTPFYLIALSLCVLYVGIVRHPQWEEHGMFYLIALSLCVLYVEIVRHPQWEERFI